MPHVLVLQKPHTYTRPTPEQTAVHKLTWLVYNASTNGLYDSSWPLLTLGKSRIHFEGWGEFHFPSIRVITQRR
jgi:hypothetical protein